MQAVYSNERVVCVSLDSLKPHHRGKHQVWKERVIYISQSISTADTYASAFSAGKFLHTRYFFLLISCCLSMSKPFIVSKVFFTTGNFITFYYDVTLYVSKLLCYQLRTDINHAILTIWCFHDEQWLHSFIKIMKLIWYICTGKRRIIDSASLWKWNLTLSGWSWRTNTLRFRVLEMVNIFNIWISLNFLLTRNFVRRYSIRVRWGSNFNTRRGYLVMEKPVDSLFQKVNSKKVKVVFTLW